MKNAPLNFTKSEFVESYVYLNGMPYSLDAYPHMRPIYNIDPANVIVLKTARQVVKSTTLANIIFANSALLPRERGGKDARPMGFRTVYVSPSVDQTKIFSYDRFTPILEESPLIKKYWWNRNLQNNVFNKTLVNGAKIYLRYALQSPDRLRGLSADMICYDEAQDLLQDSIEIINQAMHRSLYKWNYYTGTPKRKRGTLAKWWFSSTMNEWAVECGHCGKHNILTEKNIGLHALICKYCGKILNPRIGSWISTNQSARSRANLVEGFRISQLQFYGAPWIDWEQDIVYKYETESRATFYNEILGLEYDDGVVLITPEQIKAACDPGYIMPDYRQPGAITLKHKPRPSYMGIDWGPANSDNSYTVVSVIQRDEYDRFVVKYIRRFEGKYANFEYIHDEIPKIAKAWEVERIGADRGMGEASNAELRRRLGRYAVTEYLHSATLKEDYKWQGKAMHWMVNRNKAISNFYHRVKTKQYVFPHYDQFKTPFADDLMAIVADYDEDHNKLQYTNSDPDDTVHSLIFATAICEMCETPVSYIS